MIGGNIIYEDILHGYLVPSRLSILLSIIRSKIKKCVTKLSALMYTEYYGYSRLFGGPTLNVKNALIKKYANKI
jgi:hypothetical protein